MKPPNGIHGEETVVAKDTTEYPISTEALPYNLVQRNASGVIADIGTLGTAATKNTGTTDGTVPIIGEGNVLSTSILPAIAITSVYTVANLAARLALSAQEGDVAIQTDTSKTYILSNNTPGTDGNWKEIIVPTASDTVNIETLAATRVLVDGTDKTIQFLNPDGAARIVELQSATPTPTAGHSFTIQNTAQTDGAWYLTIKSGVGGTTIDTIPRGAVKKFTFDGTNWQGVSAGAGGVGVSYPTVLGVGAVSPITNGTALGEGASTGGANSVAVGYSATTPNHSATVVGATASALEGSVAVGFHALADANTSSVAIGAHARANGGLCVAVGYGSATGTSNSNAIAIGAGSACTGYGSIALGIRAAAVRDFERCTGATYADNDKRKYSDFPLHKTTTDATPFVLRLGEGVTNSAITLGTNHGAMSFILNVVAYNTTDQAGKTFNITGGIKRIGDGTVSLIGTPATAITSEDAAMSTATCAVTADNTGKSLAITVTGIADKTIDWVAHLSSVEYHA